jgi:hypothetical protein
MRRSGREGAYGRIPTRETARRRETRTESIRRILDVVRDRVTL